MTERWCIYEQGADEPKHGPYNDESNAIRDAAKEQLETNVRHMAKLTGSGDHTEWNSVRRGTPAEYVNSVPDEATNYAVWVRGNECVVIYHEEATETAGPMYYVTYSDADETMLALETDEENKAMRQAEMIRNGEVY